MSDPCECFFDHEAAMQRLIAMLRNSQTECTDTGCDLTGSSADGAADPIVFWSLLWTFVAMALFVMRPNSMRAGGAAEHPHKPSGDGSSGGAGGAGGSSGGAGGGPFDNSPPPPPPSAI